MCGLAALVDVSFVAKLAIWGRVFVYITPISLATLISRVNVPHPQTQEAGKQQKVKKKKVKKVTTAGGRGGGGGGRGGGGGWGGGGGERNTGTIYSLCQRGKAWSERQLLWTPRECSLISTLPLCIK